MKTDKLGLFVGSRKTRQPATLGRFYKLPGAFILFIAVARASRNPRQAATAIDIYKESTRILQEIYKQIQQTQGLERDDLLVKDRILRLAFAPNSSTIGEVDLVELVSLKKTNPSDRHSRIGSFVFCRISSALLSYQVLALKLEGNDEKRA